MNPVANSADLKTAEWVKGRIKASVLLDREIHMAIVRAARDARQTTSQYIAGLVEQAVKKQRNKVA